MKIAIISPMLLPVPDIKGGAVEMLTTCLIEENEIDKYYDIDLYTVYDEELKKSKYANTKIIMKKIPYIKNIFQRIMNKLFNTLKIRKVINFSWINMKKELKKHTYDKIIVENNMFLYKMIYEKKIYHNAKLIYHMHNDINNIDKTEENYKLIANTAEKILVVSEFLKNRLNKIQQTNKIQILYNCIDMNMFNKDKLSQERKNELELKYPKENNIFVGYVGRISREKGLLELVKAFKKANIKNTKLLIAGSQWYGKIKKDGYYLEIEKEIEEIKDNIYFLGNIQRDEIPSIYDLLDIIVIPTICEEAFGMVALEASAMEKGVIISDSGGLTEIVDSKTGMIVKKETNFIENLSISLEEMIENKELRERLGKNARDKVTKNLNFEKKNYLRNFKSIIGD